MTIKLEDFGPITLSAGAHESPADGIGFLEMVSFMAGEEWSDSPECACPVISAFGRGINHRFDQHNRKRLLAYVPRMIGTRSPEHEQERAEYLAWQAIKNFAPIALDKAGFVEQAETLRNFDQRQGLKAAEGAASAARAAAGATAAFAVAAADADAFAFAARTDPDAALAALDGVLAIGPSGSAYTDDHQRRVPELHRALEGA